jgi:hypothetical protein
MTILLISLGILAVFFYFKGCLADNIDKAFPYIIGQMFVVGFLFIIILIVLAVNNDYKATNQILLEQTDHSNYEMVVDTFYRLKQ